ncbi:hypothetical protein [Paenarthrobacter sp. YJN-5]|uniref:hypothetical protein n=1 Tax=Paenarthrobacter sp. YJN-5 TaxID=2735316 RepID=UPI0018777229|nr:hypothetical protein [Paenarthrobacter sp. YJN-5]QOT16497.1 hypothetical protein HMI59_07690 [Paenarthrobacter sp. YJN-5]
MTSKYDAAYMKRWKIDHDHGLTRTTTPARASEHIRQLVSQHGVRIRSIADAAGISAGTISLLNRGKQTSIKRTYEAKILAVTAEKIFNRSLSTGFVPNIGARRRLQALMAIGWRHQDLTKRVGFSTGTMMHQRGNYISQFKHEAVLKVYDQLWNVPGPADGRTMTRVAKAGYAPPLAWDDETIDDPAAAPDLGTPLNSRGRPALGEARIKKIDALAEDVDYLRRTGAGIEEIEQRTGKRWADIRSELHRAGHQEVCDKLLIQLDNPKRAPRKAAA